MFSQKQEPFPFAVWPTHWSEISKARRGRRQNVAAQSPAPSQEAHNPQSIHAPFPDSFRPKSKEYKQYERATLQDFHSEPSVLSLLDELKTSGIYGDREVLSSQRRQHSANVAQVAGAIAKAHPHLGLDPSEAWRATTMHDMLKEFPKRTTIPREFGPSPEHGHQAGFWLQSKGVVSPEWAEAIAHHSAPSHAMTPHMQVMLLADAISPDRGNSPMLKRIRRTAMKDFPAAIRMLLNAHQNDVIEGGNENIIRRQVGTKGLKPDRQIMDRFVYVGPNGRVVKGRKPQGLLDLTAVGTSKITRRLGAPTQAHLDLSDNLSRSIIGSMMHRIDSAKEDDRAKHLLAMLTGKDRRSELLRGFLPAILPLFEKRYGTVIQRAARSLKEKGKLAEFRQSIRAMERHSKLINAYSDANISYLEKFFDDKSWEPLEKRDMKGKFFDKKKHNDFKRVSFKKALDKLGIQHGDDPHFGLSRLLDEIDDEDHDPDRDDFIYSIVRNHKAKRDRERAARFI